jgi:predicted HTH domain antitoxin
VRATLSLDIPADILESARMTIPDVKLELALALFSRGRLSAGKAAELAGVSTGQFQLHLGARNLGPHYAVEDALEDKAILAASRPS